MQSTKRMAGRSRLRDAANNIAKSGINRVARQAGVVRIQGRVYPEMRGIIRMHIENVVKFAYLFAEYQRRKTIKFEDVKEALDRLGLKVWGVNRIEKVNRSGLKKPKTERKRKTRRGSKALREVRKYQKAQTLLMARSPIERLIRQVLANYRFNGRISAQAVSLIHVSVESRVRKLLGKSQLLAIHAKRKTVQDNNIMRVRQLNQLNKINRV